MILGRTAQDSYDCVCLDPQWMHVRIVISHGFFFKPKPQRWGGSGTLGDARGRSGTLGDARGRSGMLGDGGVGGVARDRGAWMRVTVYVTM